MEPSLPHVPPTAILVVAHGDGGAENRNAAVSRLATALAERFGLPTDWAVIRTPETFAAARARLGTAADGRVIVVPFFLADGYFPSVRMPRLLAEHGFDTPERLPVFGALPGLADLIARRIAALSGDIARPNVLLVAHGSASGEPAPRAAAERLADALTAAGAGRMHLAFIEEPPSVEAQLLAVRPDIVIGLFASEGTHALADVAAFLDSAPSVKGSVAAIGADSGIAAIVAAAIEAYVGGETAAS